MDGLFGLVIGEGEGRSESERAVFEEEPVGEVACGNKVLLDLEDAVKAVEYDGEEGAAASDFVDVGVARKAAAEVGFEDGGAEREALALQNIPGR